MKRKIILYVGISILLSIFQLSSAVAESQTSVFEKANKAYQIKNYSEATSLYLSIYKSGTTSFEMCYNLGNSYYKQNEFAQAIIWYERAKRLDVNNEDVNFNLNIARTKIADKIEPVPTIFLVDWWWNFVFLFNVNIWAIVTLSFFLITLLLIVWFLFSNSISTRKWALYLSFSIFSLFLITSLAAWSHRNYVLDTHSLIIIEPSCNVISSPDENSALLFVIHEGSKVRKTDQVGEWLEIKLDNGTKGWVRNEEVEVI